jgi:hypothetical protein
MNRPTTALIRFRCASCGKKNKVPLRLAGRTGRCGECRRTIKVPGRRRTQAAQAETAGKARSSPSNHRCKDCRTAIWANSDRCGRCAQSRARQVWTGWIGLVWLLVGIPLAVFGTAFALATTATSGYALTLIWMIGPLGAIAALAGAVDFARAMVCLAGGSPDPRPWATGWVMRELGVC